MKKLPKIITKEEYEQLLVFSKNTKRKNWRYYNLCMVLGFEAGLRISEIVGYADRVPALTKDKVSLEQNTIRIDSGKGQKDRIVPLPKKITAQQLKMLPIPLKRRSIQHYVTKIGQEVLNRKITFHTLRHGFGSHLASMGRPLHEIQMLMGHSRLDTTGVYLHANPKQAIDGARDVF